MPHPPREGADWRTPLPPCRQLNPHTELRLLEEHHAAALFRLIDRNRQHLGHWLPWVTPTEPGSVYEIQTYIRATHRRLMLNGGFDAGIWHHGELAGIVGLHEINWSNRSVGLGYWLGAEFQGKGLATRACVALIDYAFCELKLERIEIACAPNNRRSRAIPERLGFTAVGMVPQAEWLHDRFEDHVVYALTKDAWTPQ